ncbi:MAG: 13E12 repeat family protein, partial [Actinomycetota bacterium]|nr:13E12 repeat family protein [Actinomycetota bacterium]
MLGDTDEFQGWVEDPESIAREQFLSTLPPEGFEPDDDVPSDIFDQDDIPRVIIHEARITVAIMPPNSDPVQQIDRIHALQRLLNACAGALAAEQLAFADTQVAQQRTDQVPTRNLGRGIAEQIGYARRLAPGAASRQLGLARALADRLPQAFALLRDGLISEAQCSILAAKSSHLDETDAAILDAALAPRLTGWNLKQTEQAVQHAVYAIDPQGFVDRRGKAEQDRTVWIKPAPVGAPPACGGGMATVTALLPVAHGVAVYAAIEDRSRPAHRRPVRQTGDGRHPAGQRNHPGLAGRLRTHLRRTRQSHPRLRIPSSGNP